MTLSAKPLIAPSSIDVALRSPRGAEGDAAELPSLADVMAAIPVPEDAVCVYLSGSLLAGWGHRASDVDVYVVSRTAADVPDAWAGPRNLSVDPPRVPIYLLTVGRLLWDVEYWTEDQARQLLGLFDPDREPQPRFTEPDVDTLYRLHIGRPLLGADWLAEQRDELARSTFRARLVARSVDSADNLLEDALGMLASGDVPSATLAVREAFGAVVDALLAQAGEFSPKVKWRARKLAATPRGARRWDDYWRSETLEGYHEDPEAWVARLVRRCRDLLLEVDIR